MTATRAKIVITGAAGLVGQNLMVELESQGYTNLVGIDKHAYNLGILQELHPGIVVIEADLAVPGDWKAALAGADCVVLLHAQITGKHGEDFIRNNVDATGHVLEACREQQVPYLVHVSSSVVNSKATDHYTTSKRTQEEMVAASGISHCVLRPTLMFGWFDPKHLGWLSRFMAKTPVFPIPGDGRFMRQPLYERDFCRCLVDCIVRKPDRQAYDIVGDTRIDYVDIIRTIKRVKRLRTRLVHIPIGFFSFLLRTYAIFSRKPPFTADQLAALTAGDDFTGVDTQAVFNVKQTPFPEAVREAFCDARYANVVLQR